MSGTIESQLRYHAKHPDTPPPLRGLMLRAVEELRYRAMVIEQRNAEIKRGHDDFVQAITDPENQPSQWGTVTLALAQQGAQQPVAWYEYNQDLDAWFLAYGHNPKAKTRPLVFGDTAAPAPQAQPDWLLKTTQDLANSIRRRCFPEVPQFQVLDDLAGVISQIDNMTCGMERKSAPQAQEPCPNGSKCKHGAWCTEVYCQELCEFRNQPAPQPAQDVPEVGFGNMQSAQPVAQPLAKTCDTCAHYQQGKHPGVSIYDETCYICREYYANKWEAKSE